MCFSHLRWDFVFQRPQQLMSRLATRFPVSFWEEPKWEADGRGPRLEIYSPEPNVSVIAPHLPEGLTEEAIERSLRELLDGYVASLPGPFIGWYYTPMMLPFSRHLDTACVIYDCMDELANFRFAPPGLVALESELLARADHVFTGGYSLYETKRALHPSVHPFPSSVDRAHFEQAREPGSDPMDQADLPRPRFGYYGVIDERIDLDLIAALADARPDWSLVFVGPVVKIDAADLPRRPNIAYLGAKDYADLPAYARGWDAALMPFAINASTQFISPTKTPEYLAAGLPVVSTSIQDVVRHYGDVEAVFIAGNTPQFIEACERALILSAAGAEAEWRAAADHILAGQSWDVVASAMAAKIEDILARRASVSSRHYDYLVVGAGFAGAVMAERLARDGAKRVLVIDRRNHVGGNAFDHYDDAGILVHRYGPHIFHTNSETIVDYLSQFTKWRPYEHRVLADVDGRLLPMPINRTTLNALYGLALETDDEAAAFLTSQAEPIAPITTSADVVISTIGRDLYETFFQGYTRKQWGMDPSELDKSVTSRVPTRTNTDDRYFTDSFQAMPADGFTAMFEKILDHPLIDIELGVSFEDMRERVSYDRLVFTGPIDEYFSYRYGKLPYRSLNFCHSSLDKEWAQPVAVVNYPSEQVPFTRVTEYKHLTGQQSPRTSITHEYPSSEGDPYYPIPRAENEALFKRYEALALGTPDVLFVGRLATYRYYNMDQVVGQALATYRKHMARLAALESEQIEDVAAE